MLLSLLRLMLSETPSQLSETPSQAGQRLHATIATRTQGVVIPPNELSHGEALGLIKLLQGGYEVVALADLDRRATERAELRDEVIRLGRQVHATKVQVDVLDAYRQRLERLVAEQAALLERQAELIDLRARVTRLRQETVA